MCINGFNWPYVLWGSAVFVVTFALSLGAVGVVLVLLPATYFLDRHNRDFWIDRHPVIRWSGRIAKNLAGLILIVIGVALSVPGIPGQGLLTILIGLLLVDFPGKRRLERKLVRRPGISARINRWRARFGRPPLVLDEPEGT